MSPLTDAERTLLALVDQLVVFRVNDGSGDEYGSHVGGPIDVPLLVDLIGRGLVNPGPAGTTDPVRLELTDAGRRDLDRAELWKLLENATVRFWCCLNPAHTDVTWADDVATCNECGLTSTMTREFAQMADQALRDRLAKAERAARILAREAPTLADQAIGLYLEGLDRGDDPDTARVKAIIEVSEGTAALPDVVEDEWDAVKAAHDRLVAESGRLAAVADQLARRLRHHAHCPTHPTTEPASYCPFCRDIAAVRAYDAFVGRPLANATTPDAAGDPDA